jgi:N-acetyl-anhydromuramyl-L-alanine amidase AmpD
MIPTEIVIHHSASNANTPISEIDRWHKQRGFTKSSLNFYVGYHYVILSNGQLIQTRRDNELGCHTIPNDGKIGVCCVGNFSLEKPTDAQLDTLGVLCNKLKKDYNINEVKGHRDFSRTECPGDNLYLYVLQDKVSWLKKVIQKLLISFGFHA